MRPDRYSIHRGETKMKQKRQEELESQAEWGWGRRTGCHENGGCHPRSPPVEAKVAPLLPWSHLDTHQLRTQSHDYSSEDPLMTWSSPTHHPLFVRAAQLCFVVQQTSDPGCVMHLQILADHCTSSNKGLDH